MLSKYRAVSGNKETFLQWDFKKEEEEKEEEEEEGNVSMMEAVQESYQLWRNPSTVSGSLSVVL